jgi:hypothetical protein
VIGAVPIRRIVRGCDWAYVGEMAQSQYASMRHNEAACTARVSPLFVAAGAGIVLVLAGTAALWAYYGTAVFYEMIAAGLAACL